MKMYLRFLRMHLKTYAQYRASTLALMFSQCLMTFAMLIGLHVLFARFGSVGGFTEREVMVSASIMILTYSVSVLFLRGFDNFHQLLADGSFDRFLVRPRSLILQVLASKLELGRAGAMLSALSLFSLVIAAGTVQWTLLRIMLLLSMIAGGIVTFAGVFLANAGVTFVLLGQTEAVNILTNGMSEFGRYPMSIYGEGVLRFFTYVVPVAAFQYYPLLVLLGRSDEPLHALAPLLSLPFLIACYAVWRWGLRRYQSTGS